VNQSLRRPATDQCGGGSGGGAPPLPPGRLSPAAQTSPGTQRATSVRICGSSE
jgi:hypothetical protein